MGCGGSGLAVENGQGQSICNVSKSLLEKGKLSIEDWMFIINRREVDERDAMDMLKWFNKNYEGEITSDQFRTFFPAIGTGQHLSDMVFRTLDRDSSGTIGFMEMMLALDLVGADKFQDEVSWAFKMFDIDNSGSIVVEEIKESVQSVWKILDGIGDEIDGTVEEISEFLYERLVLQGKTEVDMQEFVKICLLDKTLGDTVLKIFRAVISTWSFIFERWSSGMFFVQTKPPKGKFWDKLSETSFQTASFHSPNPDDETG